MSCTRVLAVSVLGLASTVVTERAQATAIYTDTVLARGNEYLSVFELPLDKVGPYKVTAIDLKWFDVPLQGLSFALSTSSRTLKTMQGPGTMDFFYSTREKVFLQIYARTLGPRFAGLIGVDVELDEAPPVALPAPILLLGSALGGAGLIDQVARRRSQRPVARQAAGRCDGPWTRLVGRLREWRLAAAQRRRYEAELREHPERFRWVHGLPFRV